MTSRSFEATSGAPYDWHRTEQMRRWARLPLLEIVAAIEEMGRIAEQIGGRAYPPPDDHKSQEVKEGPPFANDPS